MLSGLKPKEVKTLLSITGYPKKCITCSKIFNCTGNCPIPIEGFDAVHHGQCKCPSCIKAWAFPTNESKKRCFMKCFLLKFNPQCMGRHPFKKRKPNHK